MPVKRQERVLVTCPHCGHWQEESPAVYSTVCKQCGGHLEVEALIRQRPRPRASRPPQPVRRRVVCFDCGAQLEVAVSAQSTMCKRWSSYIGLEDHRIAHADRTVVLKSTARFFGDVEARNLKIEAGAVLVGHARIGPRDG
jgi:transcription elongation factor Elf1